MYSDKDSYAAKIVHKKDDTRPGGCGATGGFGDAAIRDRVRYQLVDV